MPDALLVPLLLAALVTNGLAAGFFYAFACAVMPGLSRTDDRAFVSAMTAINAAVQNPLFALSFVGSGLSSAAALVAALAGGAGAATTSAVAGALALAVLQYVVTFGRSIPLNLRLDRAAGGPLSDARRGFERAWVRANTARVLASGGSLLLLGIALATT
ncbi:MULTISPECIES: anthrone oxygenase family protein [Rathayibacter]|nr:MULTISPECIES: DUF1772 domain-containing protein [Rathayibacter]MCJ1698753.1 DUF1772 domain-containing protein [Rathayibacter festucae]ROQ15459.1 putative membrane protein [Rathayibacter sp. PhB93]TDQ15397.1 putative membrane protein [Rathayibacter sp. PhB1]